MANVRIHGETKSKPIERFAREKSLLRRLPAMAYDCAVVRPTSANGCCRVILDTNRYTMPYLDASQKPTLKVYPEQLLLTCALMIAGRTLAIPITSRNCWSIGSGRASKPFSRRS